MICERETHFINNLNLQHFTPLMSLSSEALDLHILASAEERIIDLISTNESFSISALRGDRSVVNQSTQPNQSINHLISKFRRNNSRKKRR